MTYWNHRVIRHKELDGTYYYAIHEVHYEDNDQPHSMTENAVKVGGDNIKERFQTLSMMGTACMKPVIDAEDFPKEIGLKEHWFIN